MKNDILFKNIFLNQACISTIGKIKENLKELQYNVDVGDNGEWDYKLNLAIESFSQTNLAEIDAVSAKKIIHGVEHFVSLLEDTSPQEDIELALIKDFNFIEAKLDKYYQYLREHVQLSSVDLVTLENITDFICGDNNDKYPLYRSSFYLTKFFQDLGIDVEHDGSTRKVWVLSVLQNISDYDINKIVLRLVDIRIYKGDKSDWLKAVQSMSDILFSEDLKLNVQGKNVSIVPSIETEIEVPSVVGKVKPEKDSIEGIMAGGSITAGGDIIVNGTKTNPATSESFLSFCKKHFIKIIVTTVGGLLVVYLSQYFDLVDVKSEHGAVGRLVEVESSANMQNNNLQVFGSNYSGDGFSVNVPRGNESNCVWTWVGGTGAIPGSTTTYSNSSTANRHAFETEIFNGRDLKVGCTNDYGEYYEGNFSP